MNHHHPRAHQPTHPAPLFVAAAFAFFCSILLTIAFATASCASSPLQAQRQLDTNLAISNQVVQAIQASRTVPTPVTPVIEILGAIALAGLGVWNSYLHNQVAQVKSQNGKLPPAQNPPA